MALKAVNFRHYEMEIEKYHAETANNSGGKKLYGHCGKLDHIKIMVFLTTFHHFIVNACMCAKIILLLPDLMKIDEINGFKPS